jgi:hypothetical protein
LFAVLDALPVHVELVYWLSVYLHPVAVESGSFAPMVYVLFAELNWLSGRQTGVLRVAPLGSVTTNR